MTTKRSKFVSKVLNKMFKMVGFKKFDQTFVNENLQWYILRTWTKEQQQEFKKFFIKTARKDLGWSVKVATQEFSFFNFNYGWKLKQ